MCEYGCEESASRRRSSGKEKKIGGLRQAKNILGSGERDWKKMKEVVVGGVGEGTPAPTTDSAQTVHAGKLD